MPNPPVPVCRESPLKRTYAENLKAKLLKEEAEKGPRFPLSPSGALKCYRALSYDLINHDNPGTVFKYPTSGQRLLVFDMGHRVEKFVSDWLVECLPDWEIIEDKTRFTVYEDAGLKITGEGDRILKHKQTGEQILLDVKSINNRGYIKVIETKIPKDSNYYQMQLYLHSEYIKSKGITKGVLYYNDKDTQAYEMLEFDYSPDDALWALNRLRTIHKHKGKTLPREYLFGNGWQCEHKYCDYHDTCYANIERDDGTVLVIPGENPVLNSVDKVDKFVLISELLKYGDHSRFRYKDTEYHIRKLKTTLVVDQHEIKPTREATVGTVPVPSKPKVPRKRKSN